MYRFHILILSVLEAEAIGASEAAASSPFVKQSSSCETDVEKIGSRADNDSCNLRVRKSCEAVLYVCEHNFEVDKEGLGCCKNEDERYVSSSAITTKVDLSTGHANSIRPGQNIFRG